MSGNMSLLQGLKDRVDALRFGGYVHQGSSLGNTIGLACDTVDVLDELEQSIVRLSIELDLRIGRLEGTVSRIKPGAFGSLEDRVAKLEEINDRAIVLSWREIPGDGGFEAWLWDEHCRERDAWRERLANWAPLVD